MKNLYAKRSRNGKRLNAMLQIQKGLHHHHFNSHGKKKKKSQLYKDRNKSNNLSRYDSNLQQIRPQFPKMPSMQYSVMPSWPMYPIQFPQNFKTPNSYFLHRWILRSNAIAWYIQSQMKPSQNTKNDRQATSTRRLDEGNVHRTRTISTRIWKCRRN